MLDHGERAIAVIFEFKKPVCVIEGSGPLQERHWLEMKRHGVYENSKTPDKTRRAVMRVPGAGQKIRPSPVASKGRIRIRQPFPCFA